MFFETSFIRYRLFLLERLSLLDIFGNQLSVPEKNINIRTILKKKIISNFLFKAQIPKFQFEMYFKTFLFVLFVALFSYAEAESSASESLLRTSGEKLSNNALKGPNNAKLRSLLKAHDLRLKSDDKTSLKSDLKLKGGALYPYYDYYYPYYDYAYYPYYDYAYYPYYDYAYYPYYDYSYYPYYDYSYGYGYKK